MNLTAEQARDRLADLDGEVLQAAADLTETREALAVGGAATRDVSKALKNLERLQDRQANARAAVQILARREQAEAETTAREVARIKRELIAIATAKATVEAEKYREWLLATAADAEGFNQRLTTYERQIGSGSINYPAKFGSFGFLNQAIQDQVFRFTRPGQEG